MQWDYIVVGFYIRQFKIAQSFLV